jgi:hypothetical protein
MKKRPATKKSPAPLSPLQGQRQLEALDGLFDECDLRELGRYLDERLSQQRWERRGVL